MPLHFVFLYQNYSFIYLIYNVFLVFVCYPIIDFAFFFFFLHRYGLPFVSPNNILVSTVNGTGSAIEFIYVMIFIIHAPKKEKAKILGLLTFVLTVFGTVAFVSLFALHHNSRKFFCGIAATVFSIIMYGSPLSIMVIKLLQKFNGCDEVLWDPAWICGPLIADFEFFVCDFIQRTVIKTKSVEFMPFFLSLFVFLCGTSWFIYGLLGRDPFVAVSGFFFFFLIPFGKKLF